MSLRRKKYPTFNRMQIKEETFYWLDLFFHYDDYDWDDLDECGGWEANWWDYPGSGTVNSMNEYYQMKLLTLLHKLDISTARKEVNYRGW